MARHLLPVAALVALLTSCGASRPERPVRAAAPPPPPPPPARSADATPPPEPVSEIVEILDHTHPELLASLSRIGDRANAAAKAPARDPVRAEAFRRALDGPSILADLTARLAIDDTSSMPSVRDWLTSEEGKAFAAARKHAMEVRRTRSNLSGPSLERRSACRRLVLALGDGRFEGLTDFSVTTQAFLGVHAPGKVAGDFHARLIEQGPWVLERAGDLGTSTEAWPLASLESVIGFWESPAGKEYVRAIDRHLTDILQARIAEAEGTPARAAP